MPVYKLNAPTSDGRRYCFFVYWVDVYGKKQRYHSKAYAYYDDRRRAEASFRLTLNKTSVARFTFNELADEYISMKEQNVKPTTVNNIKNCLTHSRKVLGNVRISQLRMNDWQAFLHHLERQPMKNHRRNRIIEYTTAVLNYADKKYDIKTVVPKKFEKYNELVDVPLDKKMEFYTPEQFQQFIEGVDDQMYFTLFTLLFATGMRSGEALALQWKDVDLAYGFIDISKTANTKVKGGYVILPPKTRSSVRKIKLPDKVTQLLREWAKVQPEQSKDAFLFGFDRPIPNSTLQSKKKRYYQKALETYPNLPEIRLHSLRHSCASMLIHSGATVVYISKYLGHASTKETLDTYAHFFPNEADKMAGIINAII